LLVIIGAACMHAVAALQWYAMPSLTCYPVLFYAIISYAYICYAYICYAYICYAYICYAYICYAYVCNAMLNYAMLGFAMLCYSIVWYAVQCDGNILPLRLFGFYRKFFAIVRFDLIYKDLLCYDIP
jgi:hypothetical protein